MRISAPAWPGWPDRSKIPDDWKKAEPSCLHDRCSKCKGKGVDEQGVICVHMISCGCIRCTGLHYS